MAKSAWAFVPLLAIILLLYTITPRSAHKPVPESMLQSEAAADPLLAQHPTNPAWTGMAAIKYMFVL